MTVEEDSKDPIYMKKKREAANWCVLAIGIVSCY